MNKLRPLGHWQPQIISLNEPDLESDDLPDPSNLVCRNWIESSLKKKLVAYLRNGLTYNSYRGVSYCRFGCGIDNCEMGFREFTDGVWVWPEGLQHYVNKHDVMLPDEFVSHCAAQLWKVTASVTHFGGGPESTDEEAFDQSDWIAWARQMEKSLGNEHRPRLSWVKEIREVFPDWGTDQAQEHWLEVRKHLSIGQPVHGTVVACAKFGVWLDISVGHPALIEAGDPSMNCEDYPAVGDAVEAWVSFVGFCPPLRVTRQPQRAK